MSLSLHVLGDSATRLHGDSNMIWIVMPILIVLMFLLGTDLNKKSFTDVARNPRAVLIGMIGQLILTSKSPTCS